MNIKKKIFNQPLKMIGDRAIMNDRIIEVPFVHSQIFKDSLMGKSLLDFGCAYSPLVLEAASMGFKTLGVDIRNYPFKHPNLTLYKGNFLNYKDTIQFDYIVALSAIEHIGLQEYGGFLKDKNSDFSNIINKLHQLLAPNGKFIATFPVGKEYMDERTRSFTPRQARDIFKFKDTRVISERFFAKNKDHQFIPTTYDTIKNISNAAKDCPLRGSNGTGCYTWEKISE